MVNKTGVNRNTKRQPHWNGKNPAQIPDAAPRSRVALDPVAYDNLIKQHGVRVKVYRSMFCPNVKSVDGGEHNIDCTLCNGSGYLDVDPIESVAYLANQNFQEEMTVEGYHDGNSVGGTFLGGVELQYFTRVDLMDFTQPFYERVLRRADSTKGTPGIPSIPAIPGVRASVEITWSSLPVGTGAIISNAFSTNGFFEQINGNSLTSLQLEIRNISGGISVSGSSLIVNAFDVPPTTPQEAVTGIATLINNISTNLAVVGGVSLRRKCVATTSGDTLIITKLAVGVYTPVALAFTVPNTVTIGPIVTGTDTIPAVPAVPPSLGDNPDDNLKYDCKRVNVIIDKEGRQYHQDINFRLTPQGNVKWVGTDQPDAGIIYTVHYESVIQYRAISAMHINRFAQVPDKSTGLVAQVKMPEQWMLQKEFLIIRRDEYGKEIKKTGIFGDIIANQPFNPAPDDSL